MKKVLKVLLLCITLALFMCLLCHSTIINAETVDSSAIEIDSSATETEPETTEPEVKIEKPCQIKIEKTEHGSVETDITDGEIGEIVTVTVKHDPLYKIDSVTMNGAVLIESDTTHGLYTFALVDGDNTITANFVIDEELCGELTTIVKQASEKDWTNLFSIENVISLIRWLLDGGLLIAMVRYFIKDKKLAAIVEKQVQDSVEKIIPESTKNTVIENSRAVIEPLFNQALQDSAISRQLMSSMVKCMVLMQEGTPEAKIAILSEFEKLKEVTNVDSIASVKKYIDTTIAEHNKAFQETIDRLNSIGEHHQEIIEEEKEEKKDNGTQI